MLPEGADMPILLEIYEESTLSPRIFHRKNMVIKHDIFGPPTAATCHMGLSQNTVEASEIRTRTPVEVI